MGRASTDVSFVDVNVLLDNRLFVDPSAIRVGASNRNRWATAAYASLREFFDEILVCLADPALDAQGRNALAEFHEPRETRLGMSKNGFDGAGSSAEIGERIWQTLLTNPVCAVSVALLKRIEDLALFVDDVADDRISDLTTRIIIRDLVAYTRRQMQKYPTLALAPIEHTIQVWDVVAKAWTTETFTLPRVVRAGKPDSALILVPKKFVHIGLRMNPTGFWSIEAIGAVQHDRTKFDENGKTVSKPRKQDLKQIPEFEAIRPTNTNQTIRIWERDQVSLVENYRAYVDRAFEPVTQTQMDTRIPEDDSR